MTYRTARFAALVACAALTVGACSDSPVDVGSVERQVVDQLSEEFPSVESIKADCPGDITVKEGESFVCKATMDRQRTDLKVGITEVEGDEFTFQPKATQPMYEAAALSRQVKAELSASDARCGTTTVLLKRAGDTIDCSYTVGGEQRSVSFRVRNDKGELEPVR